MKRSLTDLPRSALAGTRVLVRADLNLPTQGDRIVDDRRARSVLPTLRILLEASARVIVLSHFGRPDGTQDARFSLAPVSRLLEGLLEQPVDFVPDSDPEAARGATSDLGPGEVAVLENTRFHPGEFSNDPKLAGEWARLGDIFVNDAFGTAHRTHASTVGLAEAVRARSGSAVAGILMMRELLFLGTALKEPLRPFVGVLGGAKIAGKIVVIEQLLPKVDSLLIGGAIANTFLAALGHSIGRSLVDRSRIPMAKRFIKRVRGRIVLPIDCVVADRISDDAAYRTVPVDCVGEDDIIVDIGPKTAELFRDSLAGSGTIVMNGPMGIPDYPGSSQGSESVLATVADECASGALAILGGGDSAASAEEAGVVDRLTHVSTGGGASLALLAGYPLPAVEALDDADSPSAFGEAVGDPAWTAISAANSLPEAAAR